MGAAHDAVQLQAAGRRARMPQEQPVAATDRQRPDRLLRLVVVDRQPAIAQVHLQGRPLVAQVADRLPERSWAARVAPGHCPATAAADSRSARRPVDARPTARPASTSCSAPRPRTTAGRRTRPARPAPAHSTPRPRIHAARGRCSWHAQSAPRNVALSAHWRRKHRPERCPETLPGASRSPNSHASGTSGRRCIPPSHPVPCTAMRNWWPNPVGPCSSAGPCPTPGAGCRVGQATLEHWVETSIEKPG